jgi:hypothetical protein
VPVLENFVLPWLLNSAQYKNFFSSLYTISIHFPPTPSKLDTGQAVVLGRLSLSMCLWEILACKESNAKVNRKDCGSV